MSVNVLSASTLRGYSGGITLSIFIVTVVHVAEGRMGYALPCSKPAGGLVWEMRESARICGSLLISLG